MENICVEIGGNCSKLSGLEVSIKRDVENKLNIVLNLLRIICWIDRLFVDVNRDWLWLDILCVSSWNGLKLIWFIWVHCYLFLNIYIIYV